MSPNLKLMPDVLITFMIYPVPKGQHTAKESGIARIVSLT